MSANPATLQQHWPVPLAVHRFERAAEVNAVLARVFLAMRATDPQAPPGRFYASADDLLRRIDLPEFQALLQFIAASIQATAQQANAGVWPAGRHGLQLELTGVWFQIQNGAAFHDIHTHGNCSWSGVYYVQIDPPAQRQAHPELGALNGATRFYSPMFPLLGGAHIDMGNAFLQQATLDVTPHEGDLVLFPAFLPHKAMPYAGERDRIIVSFNAQIRAPGGDQLFRYAGA
ncbi:MAG: TIGR02466 family protein [Rhodoferax sp.]|nr:TIGR02466 family protein [Rhodoferax sp.]